MPLSQTQAANDKGIIPPGPAPLIMGGWGGIETSTTRPAVPDEKVFWSDGFFPFGPGALRTLPDVGDAIYDHGDEDIYKLFCSNTSVYVFASNGDIVKVDLSTFATVTVTNTWPSTDTRATGACQILPGVIAFVTTDTPDGLFIYVEATNSFYAPGQVVPELDGFTIPTGIAGTTCETYSGRLWIANGVNLFASAPDSLINFTVADGAVSITNTDSFLANKYVTLISSGGFLYTVADSSVSYISGVQFDAGTGVTTFTNQNADPEVGASSWTDAVISVGRNIGLANYSGYYIGSGGAFAKVSQPLDGVFYTALEGVTPLSAARVDIFGRRCLAVCVPVVDPIERVAVNHLFLWDNDSKRWFPSRQSADIFFVTTWEFFGQCFAIGCDLQRVYFCFNVQSNAFTKVVQSKLWVTPEGYHTVKTAGRFWLIARYADLTSPDLTVEIDNETADATTPDTATYTIAGPVDTGFFVAPPEAIGQMGVMLGMTISTDCADMTLISAMIQPEMASYRG